jgi:hypothetical protein
MLMRLFGLLSLSGLLSLFGYIVDLVCDWNRAFHAGIYPFGMEVRPRLELRFDLFSFS